MDLRQMKGMEIAEKGGLTETPRGWVVPAQGGYGAYLVQKRNDGYTCNCPDCQTRGTTCKHSWAVIYTTQRKVTKIDKDGTKTITEEVNKTKITYTQNWKAYTTAQTSEITLFDKLLMELVNSVEEPEQTGRGRKRLSKSDLLFCSIQKVYSQLSSRRAKTLYDNSQERKQISRNPNYNAINMFLNSEDITPILHNLLTISALPLKSVETCFAQDSSGFSTTQFSQYFIQKHRSQKRHNWIKAHILVGVKTNVIVSARITEENTNDSPQFKPMVTEAYNNGFEIREVTADKAYSSRDNLEAVDKIGAVAYIPFRSSATGNSRGSFLWSKMFHYFQLNKEEFLQHYHKRSNVETAFQMIKTKLGDRVKSKKWIAQRNELLCKLIAHNIIVLIHEMFELGIKADFDKSLSFKQ